MKGIAQTQATASNTLAERLQGRFIDREYDSVVVTRSGETQIDYIGTDLVLTSKIVWTATDQYNLVLENLTGSTDTIGLKVGDVMNVSVIEVTDEYYITACSFNGQQAITKLWFE
jgi:hypothetical protein